MDRFPDQDVVLSERTDSCTASGQVASRLGFTPDIDRPVTSS